MARIKKSYLAFLGLISVALCLVLVNQGWDQTTGTSGGQGTSGGAVGVSVNGAITPGDCTKFLNSKQVQDAGGPCGTSTASVSGSTGNFGGFSGANAVGNAPATFSGNNIVLANSGFTTASDANSTITVLAGTRFPDLCAGLAYAAANATRRYSVHDYNNNEGWGTNLDPFNAVTCGNAGTTGLSASVYLHNGNYVNGTGGTIHLPPSVELYFQGRASEAQLSATTGCGGSTSSVNCQGTLLIAYNTAAPFTGSNAMQCTGCTVFPSSTVVIDYGSSGSSFGTVIQGPGTISCAGVAGSIGIQNQSAQEQSFVFHMGIVGCQSIAIDWEASGSQNSWFADVEILSGFLTGATIGTPTTFIGAKINANAPNRHYGDITCNTRGTATTAPITACVLIINSRNGRIHDVHYENANYGVIVDGSSNVSIDNINTAAASQDASTPVAILKLCAAASGAPCTSGNAATNVVAYGLQRIGPNITTNAVVDDTNVATGTITLANWNGFYSQNSVTNVNSAVRDSWCNGAVGTASATAYSLVPNSTANINCTGASTTALQPMAIACNAHNLFASASAAGAVSGSGVVILYKSGVGATALTCTLGTGTSCSDVTHAVTFAATDKWDVSVTTGQATDTTANVRVSFQCN